jgi:hypothetical protein
MTRSFSSLSISNTLCLTSLWILVALAIYVTKMQKDQEVQDIYEFFRKTNWTIWKNGTEISLPSYYLPAQSLKTITESLIWLGFVLDSAVCFTEFMVVWLKLQAPPFYFYYFSALRYLVYFWHVLFSYFVMLTVNLTWNSLALPLGLTLLYRIIGAIGMCCVNNKMSNKIDGINNPVVYAVGPTGNKAMAGA